MKQWRCPYPSAYCGKCGRMLAQDEPVMVIAVSGLQRVLVRCQGCAGQEPPADVQTERSELGLSRGEVMRRLSEIVPSLRVDARMKQTGESD
jgi:hypothetical protein